MDDNGCSNNNSAIPESAGNVRHEETLENNVMGESDLRKAIQEIQNDLSLDAPTKARKMQVPSLWVSKCPSKRLHF